MSFHTNARHAEDEDLAVLKNYAEKKMRSKTLEIELKQMKQQVVEILGRESEIFDDRDGDKTMFLDAYQFSTRITRKYSNKFKMIENVVIINGQEILASVAQLDDAAKRLTGFIRNDTFLEGHTTAVTVKV